MYFLQQSNSNLFSNKLYQFHLCYKYVFKTSTKLGKSSVISVNNLSNYKPGNGYKSAFLEI